jgi:hypothetical protein
MFPLNDSQSAKCKIVRQVALTLLPVLMANKGFAGMHNYPAYV